VHNNKNVGSKQSKNLSIHSHILKTATYVMGPGEHHLLPNTNKYKFLNYSSHNNNSGQKSVSLWTASKVCETLLVNLFYSVYYTYSPAHRPEI